VCSSDLVAPTTLGAVFAVLGARPYWHGAFTPPAMVSMALLSGTALLGIVFFWVVRLRLAGHERALTLAIPAIRLLLSIALVVAGLVVVWQMLFGLYGIIPGLADATKAVLIGPLALPFWIVRVGLGLAVPLLLLLMRRTRTPAGLFAACCLVFVGIVADRMIFVSAGQIYPGTAVSGHVSTPWAEYVPSAVEIAIVLGAFGFLGLSYTLAERYLPMGEHLGHLAGGFLAGSDPSPARASAAAEAVGLVAEGGAVDGSVDATAAPALEATPDGDDATVPAEVQPGASGETPVLPEEVP